MNECTSRTVQTHHASDRRLRIPSTIFTISKSKKHRDAKNRAPSTGLYPHPSVLSNAKSKKPNNSLFAIQIQQRSEEFRRYPLCRGALLEQQCGMPNLRPPYEWKACGFTPAGHLDGLASRSQKIGPTCSGAPSRGPSCGWPFRMMTFCHHLSSFVIMRSAGDVEGKRHVAGAEHDADSCIREIRQRGSRKVGKVKNKKGTRRHISRSRNGT